VGCWGSKLLVGEEASYIGRQQFVGDLPEWWADTGAELIEDEAADDF